MRTIDVTIQPNGNLILMRGIFSLIFGLIALTWPVVTLMAITLLFGMYALADGFFAMGSAIRLERHHEAFGLSLLEGIIGIGAGILTLLWPGITLIALSILTGVWALSTGCLEILAAFEFSKIALMSRSRVAKILLALAGIFSIGLGTAIFISPTLGAITLISLIASYAICFGFLMIGFGIYTRQTQKGASNSAPTSKAA
jgi:uncharacterized membrane protein HdeD (DUF308 family)